MSATHRRSLPAWAIGAGIAALFLGLVGVARLTGNWHTEIDPQLYRLTIPRASEFGHPR